MELLNKKQDVCGDGSTLATPSWEDRAALGHWPGGKPRGEAVRKLDVRSWQEEIVTKEMNSRIFYKNESCLFKYLL